MVTPHAYHTSTLLGDGRVLVAGGLINDRLDGKVSAAAELYDPTSGTWSATTGMLESRWGHTATLLRDGRVLVAGSYRNSAHPLASAELYDPRGGRWTVTGNMNRGRGGHTATLLADGRVLVVGGGAEDTLLEGGPRSATAELYDPETGEWTVTGSMIEPRNGFTATLLQDGAVLAVGGDPDFTTAELYDPGTGRWTATGSMADGRFSHTATLLSDGTVLVAGGFAGSDYTVDTACSGPPAACAAERYDPASGRWTWTGRLHADRVGHTATLLSDGTVLVVGRGADEAPASAELYDQGSGRWTVTVGPAGARSGYTATLLLDGRVLLAGDYDYESAAPTELYDPGTQP